MALEAVLKRNDGSETFTLQAERVERSVDNSPTTRAALATVGELVGHDPVLNTYTFEIEAHIQDVSASDYPNSGNYSDHDFGFENEIIRAALEWGPDATDGFDVFEWGDTSKYTGGGSNPRIIDVIITNVTTEENRDQRIADAYDLNIELFHFDVYTG